MSPLESNTTPDPVDFPDWICTTDGSASLTTRSYARWVESAEPCRAPTHELHRATTATTRIAPATRALLARGDDPPIPPAGPCWRPHTEAIAVPPDAAIRRLS